MRPLEGIITKNDLNILLKTLKNYGSKFTYRKDKNNKKVIYEANISLFDCFKGTIKRIVMPMRFYNAMLLC